MSWENVYTLGVMAEQMIQRAFRIKRALWEAAKTAAAKNGERISDVIRRALENYVKETNQ